MLLLVIGGYPLSSDTNYRDGTVLILYMIGTLTVKKKEKRTPTQKNKNKTLSK